jgi:hypothetical protein
VAFPGRRAAGCLFVDGLGRPSYCIPRKCYVSLFNQPASVRSMHAGDWEIFTQSAPHGRASFSLKYLTVIVVRFAPLSKGRRPNNFPPPDPAINGSSVFRGLFSLRSADRFATLVTPVAVRRTIGTSCFLPTIGFAATIGSKRVWRDRLDLGSIGFRYLLSERCP